MNYFICDIIGVFCGGRDNRISELKKFVDNLKKLIEVDELTDLTFCFSSSEDMSEMRRSIEELESILKGEDIKIGPHFSYDEKMENGKIRNTRKGKVYHAIDILKNREVNNVYIADASFAVQDVVRDTLASWLEREYILEHGSLEGYKCYNKLIQFTPGSDDETEVSMGSRTTSILGLNECLEKYIKKISRQKTYKRID